MNYSQNANEIIKLCQAIIERVNQHLRHFPRHEKYALSQEIRQAMYGMYGILIECEKKYHNKTSLTKLDIQHEQLRMLVNLAFSLGYYEYKTGRDKGYAHSEALKRYASLSGLIDSLGEMIGGWIRSLRVSAA
jgi:hypothetical protein